MGEVMAAVLGLVSSLIVRRIYLGLICLALVACSTQPKHTLIERSAQNDQAPVKNRYATKQQHVPPVVSALLRQAIEMIAQSKYDQAISVAERAQRLAPKVSEVYLVLGHAYRGLSKSEKANNMYQRANALATNAYERRRAQRALQEGE